jgi:hypothetical protein
MGWLKIIKKSNKNFSRKGVLNPLTIGLIMIALLVLLVTTVLSDNGNGLWNIFYDDVVSGTPVVDGCSPKQYVVEMRGTLDLINDFVWGEGYRVYYVDSHIDNIDISQLGIFQNEFDAKVCLYDVLANGDHPKKLKCETIKDKVTKGQIEKFPFMFRYNLPDNNCDGQVDDHTFNLVAEVQVEEGFERHEKTVAIVNGQARFQNAEY